MEKYLFVFGFETPEQKIANSTYGYDDEDSAAVFIRAKNEEEALNWGKQIIKEAMRFLYKENTSEWSDIGIIIENDGLYILRHDLKDAFLYLDNIKEKLEEVGGYDIEEL